MEFQDKSSNQSKTYYLESDIQNEIDTNLSKNNKPNYYSNRSNENLNSYTIRNNFVKNNKKEKKVYYKGTMNNSRGIPPLPNWSNRFSSIIINNNLLYLSNNYIVNINLNKKEFIQLIHSSLNVYFDNKFSVICRITNLVKENEKNSYMFIAIDSNGNICFFTEMQDFSKKQIKNSNIGFQDELEHFEHENQNIYFREERYVSKISRLMIIKSVLNVNLFDYYYNQEQKNSNKIENKDLNIIIIGDNNGNINILKYFYNKKESEMQIDKNSFSQLKLAKGVCTDLAFIKEKNILIVSTTNGNIEFYSFLKNSFNYHDKQELLRLTHVFDSNLNFIFSMDYFLSDKLKQINLSLLDRNGSFLLYSINFDEIRLDKENCLNQKIQSSTEDCYFKNLNNQIQNYLDDVFPSSYFYDSIFNFKILDKNRFNNKAIQDQYLYFTHKLIIKNKNENFIEIYFTSNKGKIYYSSIELNKFLLGNENIQNSKLFYFEILENPNTKNIFCINEYSYNKMVFLSADGVISIFDHSTKFFEIEVKTIKYKPLAFVDNIYKEKNLFFYDEGNKLFKYNYSKQVNGLQVMIRDPLKIKSIKENDFQSYKKNKSINKKELKDFIKIKMIKQSDFNENIFSLIEYNSIFKSYYISVYDFSSDTRIYRKDLLFKVMSMKFAFQREFASIEQIFENREDLIKSQNNHLNNINNIIDNFYLDDNSKENEILESVCKNKEGDIEMENLNNDFNFKKFVEESQNSFTEGEKDIHGNIANFINYNYTLDLNEETQHVHLDEKVNKISGNLSNENVSEHLESNNKMNKKVKSKKICNNNYDEKKYFYSEKYKQIIQQIFSENNKYQLLHLIDENNNFIVIDFIKNECNIRKLREFNFKHKKVNKSNNKSYNEQLSSLINDEHKNNFEKQNLKQDENLVRSKHKTNNIVMFPLNDFHNFDKFYKNKCEDFLIINFEDNCIKIGIVNQIEDVFIAKVNILNNEIVYNNPDKYEFFLKNKEKDLINPFYKNENSLNKISMEFINFKNVFNNDIADSKNFKDNYMLFTLENEKNLRIIKFQDFIFEILAKFNIWENLNNYKLRKMQIFNYINEIERSTIEAVEVSNVNSDFNNKNYLEKNSSKQVLWQINYKNFSNVPALHLKIFQQPNLTEGKKSIINIITSQIDNSIKYFEFSFNDESIFEFNKANLVLKYSINAHIAKIQEINFLTKTKIASLSYDQSMKIWDITKCKIIDLPILMNIATNKNTKSINKDKDSNFPHNNNKKNFDNRLDESNKDKKLTNKIFPIFTKIVNDAIYSQSYSNCNEFINNLTNFYDNLKQIKNTMDDNYQEKNIENYYKEFLPNLKSDDLIEKNILDYYIFIFSEVDSINHKTIIDLIKFEYFKSFNENTKINSKNMQVLFCLLFYIFIFAENFYFEFESSLKLLNKLKIKIELLINECNDDRKHRDGETDTNFNENNTKYLLNLLIKLESIIQFIDNEFNIHKCNQEINNQESKTDKLLQLIEFIFNDFILRGQFFELLLKKKFEEAEVLLDDNELYFENIFLSKLLCHTDKSYSFGNKSFIKFKEKLNKFRAFIYTKQIYQAQKCQAVINILNNYYELN